MGKRKKAAKKPQGPKRNEPLPSIFPCLFCNHEKSVEIKLDKKAGIGSLVCKVCGQNYQMRLNYLSAAVDVYSDWVDACDAVAKANNGEVGIGSSQQQHQITDGRSVGRDTYDDEEREGYEGEGIVPDDDYD